MAEHALHFKLSLKLPFVEDSCFLAHSDPEVEKVGNTIISDIEKIEKAGNSAGNRNSKLLPVTSS